MAREAKLIVACGKKGVGKTYQTFQMLQKYIKGDATKGVPARRVLILDVNDEYENVKSIAVKDILLFSIHPFVEIRRVRPFRPDGNKMTLDEVAETLSFILEKFRNGMLVIEDVSRYVGDHLPNDLIGAIATNRHSGMDIVIHYQGIGRLTPKIIQNMNVVRLHKITDTVERHKNKFEDKFQFLAIAQCMVNQQYFNDNQRFFVFIDIDEEKIYGDYTKEMFEEALDEFVSANYNQLVGPLLKSRNNEGKKQHDYASALDFVKQRMRKSFSQFKY